MPGSNGNSIMPSFDDAPSGASSVQAVSFSPSVTPASSSGGSDSFPLFGFLSSLMNNLFTRQTNRENREWQEQQNNLAWERQQQLIQEQRNYDTPKAQMERLMEAGLNPNLIYGDLNGGLPAASAPNAAGTYQGVAPQIDPNLMLIDAQARALNAQAGLDTSQSNRIDSLTPHEVDNLIKDTWLKGQSGEKIIAESNMIMQNTAYIKSQLAYVDTLNANEKTNLANKIIDLCLREAYMDSEFEAYAAKLGCSIQEYKYAVASFSLRLLGVKANNSYLASLAHLNTSNAKSIDASLPYLDALYRAQKNSAVINAGISAIDYKLISKDLSWYTSDKIFQYGTDIMYGVGQVISPFKLQLGGKPSPIGYR